MIRAGRLRAERVHRPQGTAFLVELPNATAEVAQDAMGDVSVGHHNATPGQPLSPALLAAAAWARGVVEPLSKTIAEQQQQLVSQAETIGRLTAENETLRAAQAALGTRTAPQSVETAPGPFSGQLHEWIAAAVAVLAIVIVVVLLAWPH